MAPSFDKQEGYLSPKVRQNSTFPFSETTPFTRSYQVQKSGGCKVTRSEFNENGIAYVLGREMRASVKSEASERQIFSYGGLVSIIH
jgi:hypothetical protein